MSTCCYYPPLVLLALIPQAAGPSPHAPATTGAELIEQWQQEAELHHLSTSQRQNLLRVIPLTLLR